MAKKAVFVTAALLMMASVVVYANDQGGAKIKPHGPLVFATVVKSIAFNWFKRMETGVVQFGKDKGVKAFMQGPSVADSAAQVSMIQELIAQKPTAILNVPYGVEEQEPVQKKAMDAGIIVVTMESSNAKNAHYDVEAFDNKAFGEELMRQLAAAMSKKGKYIQFVGALSNKSHGEWTDSAVAYQKANFPNMEFIGKYESKEDVETAYQITKDMLKAHPDLAGIQGSAAGDTAGAARAVQEAGLAGKIAVGGTGIPSYSGDFLKSGAMTFAIAWDPRTQGYAANVVALKIVNGEKITDGMDLGVPGYNKIKLVTNTNGVKVIYGSAWIQFKVDNLDQYPF